jgi:hypothetical protein
MTTNQLQKCISGQRSQEAVLTPGTDLQAALTRKFRYHQPEHKVILRNDLNFVRSVIITTKVVSENPAHDHHDKAEILLKVALNTINQNHQIIIFDAVMTGASLQTILHYLHY